MDQGKDSQGKGGQDGFKFFWRTLISAVLLVGVTNLSLVDVLSRRIVIQETFLGVPDPNPLQYFPEKLNNKIKMSVIELKSLSNDDLKKQLIKKIDIEEWIDKCSKCGYPKMIHKKMNKDATCMGENDNKMF